jgi:hypothetical protein
MRVEARTHELVFDELFPSLVFSLGRDHRPLSLKFPLQLDIPLMGTPEHIQSMQNLSELVCVTEG